jgi:hypothetical protein
VFKKRLVTTMGDDSAVTDLTSTLVLPTQCRQKREAFVSSWRRHAYNFPNFDWNIRRDVARTCDGPISLKVQALRTMSDIESRISILKNAIQRMEITVPSELLLTLGSSNVVRFTKTCASLQVIRAECDTGLTQND